MIEWVLFWQIVLLTIVFAIAIGCIINSAIEKHHMSRNVFGHLRDTGKLKTDDAQK